MHTPEPSSGTFSFNNGNKLVFLLASLLGLAGLAFWVHFTNPHNFIPLFIGIGILFLTWEAFIASYLIITYNNGTLIAEKPRLKYSFLFSHKTRMIEISPDSFDQLWIVKKKKGTYQLLFVVENQVTACILWDGNSQFKDSLISCYPDRVFSKDKSYHKSIKKLRKAFPYKVI